MIICARCHKQLPDILHRITLNGGVLYICEECYEKKENLFICKHCKHIFDITEMSDEDDVCLTCYINYYFKKCGVCGKIFNVNYLNAVENEDTLICNKCLDDSDVYGYCELCHDIYNMKDMYYCESKNLWCCEYCYNNL